MQFDVPYDERVLRTAVDTFMKRRLMGGIGWLGVLALVVTVAALAHLLWQGDRSWVVGAIGARLVLLAMLISVLWQWRLKDIRQKLDAVTDRKGRVTLTEDSLSIITMAGGTTLPWSAITEI